MGYFTYLPDELLGTVESVEATPHRKRKRSDPKRGIINV